MYDEALAWAEQFSGAASYALRAAKESIDRGLEVDLETGLEIERQQFAALFATEDRTIGMASFVENGPGKASSSVAEPVDTNFAQDFLKYISSRVLPLS